MLRGFTRAIAATTTKRATPTSAKTGLFARKNHSAAANSAFSKIKLGRLNHVAIAVPDLNKAISFYRDILGAKVSEAKDQVEHGVTTVFVKLDNTNIELLLPLGEKSPIGNFLKKKPDGGVHHVCLEVDDIYGSVEELKSRGIVPIDPKPKIGAHGKPVVFLHPRDCNGVLVELEQK
jgi:methylmalonyl-CoA/ethylmalonyl-CoA epimerase